MKLKGVLIIVGLVVALAVLAAFAAMGFVFMDGMSYTATGHETLSPAGAETGKALVVYDPGMSGQAKNVAALVAGDLRAKGYAVDLAGVRSTAASNVSGYDVLVIGGPIYAGNASSSIGSYLKALVSGTNARVGVFATGQDADIRSDPAALRKEVAPLADGSSLKIDAVMKVIQYDDADKMCAAFVDDLLK